MKQELKYENIVDVLLKRIPEFGKSRYYYGTDKDLNYVMFGHFALFIRDELNKKKYSNNLLKKCFPLLNEMMNSGDKNLENLAVVGTLEILIDSDEEIRIVKKYLKGKSIKLFNNIIKCWYGEPV